MTITAKKIINSLLMIALTALIAWLAYYFAGKERLLTGSILDGAIPSYIEKIEFNSPSGSVSPVNNAVEIKSVFVNFNSTGEAAGFEDGDLYEEGIANSFIEFKCTTTCPAGVQITDNKIFVPDTFISFTIDIWLPTWSIKANSTLLTITSVDCSYLRTSLMKGTGAGIYTGTANLPTSSSTVGNQFKFDVFSTEEPPVYQPIETVILNYPTTTVSGAQTFQITINFAEDVGDANIPAEIVTSSPGGIYTIDVRDEGSENTSGTASNFAYVFNDLLGGNSPFTAAIDPMNSSWIVLTSKELGEHTNDYLCNVNGAEFGTVGKCFSGATDGNVSVLSVPLTLDNSMIQGESALVYAAGSVGENKWISGSPSILEASLLSEIGDETGRGIAEFLSASLPDTGEVLADDGTFSVTNCTIPEDDSDEQTCDVSITVPVKISSSQAFDTIVTLGTDTYIIPVRLTGDLTGFLTSSGVWSNFTGLQLMLTGEVTGNVSGNASSSQGADGMVFGTVIADASVNVTIPEYISIENLGKAGYEPIFDNVHTTSEIDAKEPLTSTVTKIEEIISDIAVLYAKRPGKSILTVTDAKNCTAALEVEVIAQKVILQMTGRDPGDVLEVGDTVSIKAYAGDAQAGIDEKNNITAKSEWKSSNEKVATIQDGILTAVAPGITQITATYNTGVAEIGEINSDPLTVTVNKISGLTIALNEAAQQVIPAGVKQAAYKSVLFIVHDPNIAGKSVNIEGQQIPIALPDRTYKNNMEKINAIATEIQTSIDSQNPKLINVKRLTDLPGVLVLEPTSVNTNGIIDITTTATVNQATIVPNFSAGLNLPADETYGLMAIANYDNGRTKRLLPTDVTWVNTPVNYLDSAMLETGLLKKGEKTGTSTVYAKFENADASMISSNLLAVTVEAGPVIEYARRIGTGAITKGGQINLQMKVTDVDTIADIQDINISLVKSEFSAYNEINADSGAVWFAATAYPDQIVTEEESAPADGVTPAAPTALVFRTYDIPVTIPGDANLFDGQYKLVISITDTNNNTLNYVFPIYIGEIASGDVDGNGVINMVDVIFAFRIAAGTVTPTQNQLQAANTDGKEGVTMVDVILLFQQVASN